MIDGLRPDFVLAFVLLDVVIILVAARLVGGLATKVGQPRVVGEIVAGILLGPSLLGATVYKWDSSPDVLQCDSSRSWWPVGTNPETFTPRPESITECLFPLQSRGVLSILGQVALIFFMFLVGIELDFDALKSKVKGIVSVGLGVVALPIAAAFIIGPALYNDKFAALNADGVLPKEAGFTLFIAAMLSVTAFPVMARILQEKNLTTSAMGAVGIASAAVVTVLMFILIAVAKGVTADQSAGDHSKVFIGTAIYLVVMFGVIKPLLAMAVGSRIEGSGKVDTATFAGLLIVAFLSAYVADRIGINVIVGGFVAGAILPVKPIAFRDMGARLSEVTGTILLPIFLAFSGLNTDFTKLKAEHIGGLALLLVAAIVSKWAGGAVFAKAGGLSWAEGNVLGILMNCRGLLVLVVGLIAKQAGVITDPMQVGAVVIALVTTAMTGPLFDTFLPKATGQGGGRVKGSPTVAADSPI